jgi:hypothetical protein
MLNYKSVRSSEPQIRSNPALRHISDSSGFQKRISTLLEPTPPPFPTFQILKEGSQTTLEQHQYYGWIRPAHLRSNWIILADGMPLILMDPRNTTKLFSLRIPFDKRQIQQKGIVVLEGAWDAQDHILWIWDVLLWEKALVWNTMTYSTRWGILKMIASQILDCGHPMSDAEVCLPTWESLQDIRSRQEIDSALSIEFQPEKAGLRRHTFLVKNENIKFKPTSHHERKMVSLEPVKSVQKPTTSKSSDRIERMMDITSSSQENERIKESMVSQSLNTSTPTPASVPIVSKSQQPTSSELDKTIQVAYLRSDPYSKLPDTYRLTTIDTKDLGLAAIRSLELSKRLRTLFQTTESILVDIQWFEPFHKFEVKKVHS